MPEKKYSPNVLIDNKNTKEAFGPSYTGWVPIKDEEGNETRGLIVLVPSYTGWVPITTKHHTRLLVLVLVPSYTGWVPIRNFIFTVHFVPSSRPLLYGVGSDFFQTVSEVVYYLFSSPLIRGGFRLTKIF